MQLAMQVILLYLLAPFCVPITDAVTSPNSFMHRDRPVSKCCRSIVAGLDNMRPIDESSCWNNKLIANCTLSSPVQCARTCRKGDRRICYYNFQVEFYQIYGPACDLCTPDFVNNLCPNCQCVPADGIERTGQVVNRQMPGPSIEVCEGDHVVIDVTNRMPGCDLAIHWHGILQHGYQYYDGAPFVTQCPIGTGDTFRYQWAANYPGTYFWHAHGSLQKMDGVFGSIVIRQPPEKDPHCHLYDYDLSEHVMVINDWMHEQAVSHLPGTIQAGPLPDSVLIDGKGQYTDPNTGATTNTTLTVINVEPGKRYRIRMINAFCTSCPGLLTIEAHKMTIISTDGKNIKPVIVDSLSSVAGERYNFILHANKFVGSYWIQLRAMGLCEPLGIQQLAILRYKGAPDKPPLQPPTYDESLPQGTVLNALNACDVPTNDAICVSKLESITPIDKEILEPEADEKYCLFANFHAYTRQEIYRPNQYFTFIEAPGGVAPVAATINNISFTLPSSPPLSQPMDIPNQFCNETTLPAGCTKNMCYCTHTLNIRSNSIVEMTVIDGAKIPGLPHSFHMHGYAFYVMDVGLNTENMSCINYKIVQKMDKRNQINRCFDQPVRKDTVIVPSNGYLVLRFLADNPGYWLFHCHFVYHQIVGMSVLLKVGERKDIPPVPKNFPKCGNFLPPIICNTCPPYDNNKY